MEVYHGLRVWFTMASNVVTLVGESDVVMVALRPLELALFPEVTRERCSIDGTNAFRNVKLTRLVEHFVCES